jgi:myo-inositol 2-dehydrogenase/D-chiro-inositol 1-dehydrogenase
MSEQEVGLAIVGCAGDIQAHREAVARLVGGVVSVVVYPDPDAARVMAEAVGASFTVATVDEALDSHPTAFDAIVIRGPLPDRLAAIDLAAQNQKHVHTEAPVATTLDDTNAAIDACASAGVCLSVGSTLRALPSNRMIKDRVSDRKLGVPGILRGHRWCSGGASGTGILVKHIYGDIDLAAWLFEAMPSEIYALSRRASTDGTIPEYLQIHLGFPGGGMALFDFATALPVGQEYHSHFLIGSTGAAYADDHHNSHLLYRGGDPSALISREDHRRIADELQGFVTAIREKTPPPVPGEEARIVHQIVEGIMRSLEAGHALELKETAYEPV